MYFKRKRSLSTCGGIRRLGCASIVRLNTKLPIYNLVRWLPRKSKCMKIVGRNMHSTKKLVENIKRSS